MRLLAEGTANSEARGLEGWSAGGHEGLGYRKRMKKARAGVQALPMYVKECHFYS